MRTAIVAAALMLATLAQPAGADVLVVIDKSTQQVRVLADGGLAHVFKTSTGRYGNGTPNGSYGVERLHRHWYSRKYDNAPMPYSIFFHEGYAIHGTTVISRLGRPASHGCVRLHPDDAAVLFALVREQGKDNTVVIVTGTNPKPKPSKWMVRKRDRKPERAVRRVRTVDPGLRWWRERS
jgi:lipoprotein-anchoring transpeptidase ErfK/SrfK